MTINSAIDVGCEDRFTSTKGEALKRIRCSACFHILDHNVWTPNKEVILCCCRIPGPMRCGSYVLTDRDDFGLKNLR
jgi:hypothetical protein